ncbi:phage head closure protein [Polaromonas jejuensis]|uniref:Phage head closure protein n=1 Tax=Polaromonas jejuensis TaxID=457502 RepID=A0ABW0QI72_9BURK|nr:phage head closure protein [Polaromonas jejuensis]
MQAGPLRKRVVFQCRDTAVDSYGQQVTTWTDAFTAWAAIEALSAREVLAAQAVQSEASHRITVRYRGEFTNPVAVAAMRINYNGRLFNISGATNTDERNRTVEIMASEGMNNG